MPRIRTIKPEFWADEKLASLDCITRFVFLGLIGMADDAGRMLDNVKIIDAFIFPETSETCRDSLAKLSRMGRIVRGKTASGQPVIQIVNWTKHQKVDKPNNKTCLPEIVEPAEKTPKNTGENDIRENVANDSRERRDTDANASRDSRVTTDDRGPTTMDRRPTTDVSCSAKKFANSPPATEPLTEFEFPIVGEGGPHWHLTQQKFDEYVQTYPDLNIAAEMRVARQFFRDNKSKRKTAKGMPKTLNSWLARSQNNPRMRAGGGKASQMEIAM